MVICGATGDLTERKLGPALYNLLLGGFLPPEFTVVGFARREMTDDAFRDHLRQGVDRYSRNRPIKESIWESFAQGSTTTTAASTIRKLVACRCWTASTAIGAPPATALLPGGSAHAYPRHRPRARRCRPGVERRPRERPQGWSRVIVEKPFGFDLAALDS